MRALVLSASFVIGASIALSYLAGQEQPRSPKADTWKAAEQICQSLAGDKSDPNKIFVALKITEKEVAIDFANMRKGAMRSEELQKGLEKFAKANKIKLPIVPFEDKDEGSLLAAEFLVAVWFEWRIMKEDGIEAAFKESSNLVKVRFKSMPDGAKVFVNGALRGKTVYHLVLNSTKKYDILIQKDGHQNYEKTGYTPSDDDPAIDVELVKSK